MHATLGLRMLRQTPRMMAPVKPDGTSFFARLRKIPPELVPLGAVVGFAIFAAGFATVRKFVVDKNLRLSRQGLKHDDHPSEHH